MFKNRVRLPFYLRQPQFPSERNVFPLSDGSVRVLSNIVRKTYQGLTDNMDEGWHQKLAIALAHDEVTIEGDRYFGDVVMDGDYSINWVDFLDYPLGQATFQVRVSPFDATNDNCATCEDATQLSLVDDSFLYPLTEGEVETISVFDNDSICCYPIVAEITTFNTNYFSSVEIDQETGIVTFTLFPSVFSSAPGTVLATYRVTCPDGSYDEADIIGEVVGTETPCLPPSDLTHTHIDESEITTESDEVSWTGTGDWEWQLFDCSNLGTPIDTGTTSGNLVTFLSLSPGTCYTFSIRQDCGEGMTSDYISLEFTTPAAETLCGLFNVSANDGTFNRVSYGYSYMDCAGNIQTKTIINLSSFPRCMLMDSFGNPVYFSGGVNVTVSDESSGPC